MPPGKSADKDTVREVSFSSSSEPARASVKISMPDRQSFAEATSPQPLSSDGSDRSSDDLQSFLLNEFTRLSDLGKQITASNVGLCLKFLEERRGSLENHAVDFDGFYTELFLPFCENYPAVSRLCEDCSALKKEGVDRQLKFAKAVGILKACHGNFLAVKQGEWYRIENAKEALAGKINPNHFGSPSRRFTSNEPEDKKLREQYTADVLRFVWKLRVASFPGRDFRPDEDPKVNFTLLHEIDPVNRERTGFTTNILENMFPKEVLDQLSMCITQTPTEELTDFYKVWLAFITPLQTAKIDVALVEKVFDIYVDDKSETIHITMHFRVFTDTSAGVRDNPFALSADPNMPFLDFWCVFDVKNNGRWGLTAQYQDNTCLSPADKFSGDVPRKKFEPILRAHFEALNRKPFDSPPAHGIVQRYSHARGEGLQSARQDLHEKFKDASADAPLFSYDRTKGEAYVTPQFYGMLTRDFPGLLFRPPPRQASDESELDVSPLCS